MRFIKILSIATVIGIVLWMLISGGCIDYSRVKWHKDGLDFISSQMIAFLSLAIILLIPLKRGFIMNLTPLLVSKTKLFSVRLKI